MSGSVPPRTHVESEIRERLAVYARYTAIMAAQESALEEGDLDQFNQLGGEREELQEHLGPVPREWGAGPLVPRVQRLVEQAAETLRAAQEQQARIELKLSDLRRQTGDSIRNLATRRPQVRSYLSETESRGSGGIDVRS